MPPRRATTKQQPPSSSPHATSFTLPESRARILGSLLIRAAESVARAERESVVRVHLAIYSTGDVQYDILPEEAPR